MKRSFLAFTLAAALATPAFAGTQTISLSIPQMTGCPSCPFIVKSVLSRVEGVSQVEAVYETGIATVVYDDEKATLEDLLKALADNGYEPDRITPQGTGG